MKMILIGFMTALILGTVGFSGSQTPEDMTAIFIKAMVKKDFYVMYCEMNEVTKQTVFEKYKAIILKVRGKTSDKEIQKKIDLITSLKRDEFFKQIGSVFPDQFVSLYNGAKIIEVRKKGDLDIIVIIELSNKYPQTLRFIKENGVWKLSQ